MGPRAAECEIDMPVVQIDEKSVFNAARQIEDAAEREAYVQKTCREDRQAAQRICELLRVHEQDRSFLESPAGAAYMPTMAEQPLAECAGTVIGPYKLLEQIGEGGFGVVFMAEQSSPVRRKVAVKVIKPGMDTRQVIARFEAERQALALMDHPHIAKVLDAGATENGRPYFVMELVKGIPITGYCDQHQLALPERLELFITVCQAVQHAHQKGIIHRDLKPSNVLVADFDDRAVPKIIDFGVAKAMCGQLTDKTLFTGFAQLLGTPLYMSPEQAALNSIDIDTRSDVYSLGVLLYELLTGTTPLGQQRLWTAPFDETLRLLREEDPPKPSTRLATIDNLRFVAANRHMEPVRLTRLVRGELDWIVMKALEKDRSRRYQTATGFASDVERYLADEEVQACPPTTVYRLCKFARRNKATLVAAVLVLGSLIGGIVGTSWQAVRATDERNEKEDARRESAANERKAVAEAARARDQEALAERERVRAETNFRLAREAVDQMLTRVAEDMADKPHMEQIRRALLTDALKFYEGFLQQKRDDPSVRHETARAYWRVGTIHETLGNGPQAEEALRQAVALLEKLGDEFPAVTVYREDLAGSRTDLAYRLVWTNKQVELTELRRRDLALWEKLATDFPAVPHYQQRLAHAHTNLGNALKDALKRLPEAEKHHRLALTVWDKFHATFPDIPEDRSGLSHSHLWLGVLLLHTDRLSEAEAELHRALALREQMLAQAPDAPDLKSSVAHVLAYMGELLASSGKPLDAAQYYQRAIDIRENLRDDFPDDKEQQRRLGIEYRRLSVAMRDLGRTQEAEEAIRSSVAIREKLVADHPGVEPHGMDLGNSRYELGLLLHDAHRSDEAAEEFRRAQKLLEQVAEGFPNVAEPQLALARLMCSCPAVQFRDAERAMELAHRVLQHVPSSRMGWHVLGIAHYRAGKWQSAIESLETAMDLGKGGNSSEWFFLAMAHWQLSNKDQARRWFDQATEWMDANKPLDLELRHYRTEAEALTGFEGQD